MDPYTTNLAGLTLGERSKIITPQKPFCFLYICMIYRLLPFDALFMALKHGQMDCCRFISKSRSIINVVTSSHFPHHKFYQVSTIPKQLNNFCHKDLLAQTIKLFPHISPVCFSPYIFFLPFQYKQTRNKLNRKNKNKPCELSSLRKSNLPE